MESNRWQAGRFSAAASLFCFLSIGCHPESESSPGATPSAKAGSIERDLLDLVAAVTPLPASAPAVDQSDWHIRRQETLERLRAASHAHGLAALALLEEKQGSEPEVRADILDVAAHAAPEETRDLLVKLVGEYGPAPLLRRRAAELLGDTLPETALEVLGPILRGEVHGRTLPPEETLLEAWNRAATQLGHDRIPLLCAIATDLHREQAVRYLATRLLGEFPSPQGSAALEQLIVESNGDHLIRRYAAQSLQKTLAKDEFCARIRAVLEKETDINFQIFLRDVLDRNCR